MTCERSAEKQKQHINRGVKIQSHKSKGQEESVNK